jgi:hypothetical protein
MSDTDSATCARIVLSEGLDERTIIAGTSSARREALSDSGRGLISY